MQLLFVVCLCFITCLLLPSWDQGLEESESYNKHDVNMSRNVLDVNSQEIPTARDSAMGATMA